MTKTTRTAEIDFYRDCDTKIAAEWSKYWIVSDQMNAIAKAIENSAKYANMKYNQNERYQTETAAKIAKFEGQLNNLRPVAEDLRTAAIDLDKALYTGWSRFFLVKHIHSNNRCSSFRMTTRVAWLPNVSGLTEAEAVAEHGETLCTICFPSAPTELTTKQADPSLCSGSGKFHSTEHKTGRENAYVSPSGYCPDCLRWNTLTKNGLMRKHKVDETKRHALTK